MPFETFYLTIAVIVFLVLVHIIYGLHPKHHVDKDKRVWYKKYKPLIIIDFLLVLFLLFVYILRLVPSLL